jgi:Leucine-rich repeat (LRR) protein
MNLRQNNIEDIPAELANMQELLWLDISSNRLKVIPSELVTITTMQHLNLSFNWIEDLPYACERLLGCTQLDVSHNQLERLPFGIAGMRMVTDKLCFRKLQQWENWKDFPYLRFDSNPIREPPTVITRQGLEKTCHFLGLIGRGKTEGVINISNCELEILPFDPEPFAQHLTRLDISCNHIKGIPVDVCLLTCLEELNLSENELTKLPGDLRWCIAIRQLDLHGNFLDEIPVCVAFFTRLETLSMAYNCLEQFAVRDIDGPYFITSTIQLHRAWQSLSTLDLSHNQLTTLPAFLISIAGLIHLNVRGNGRLVPAAPDLPILGRNRVLAYLSFFVENTSMEKKRSDMAKLLTAPRHEGASMMQTTRLNELRLRVKENNEGNSSAAVASMLRQIELSKPPPPGLDNIGAK